MSQPLLLQVSDRTFFATKSTLIHGIKEGSGYFECIFDFNDRSFQPSSTETNLNPNTPSYYLDLDPDVFKLVLDYLKSGVMPLLWDQKTGFDHSTYAKLEQMADFLQVPRLTQWVKDKKYLQAIKQNVSMFLYDYRNSLYSMGSEGIEFFLPSQSTKDIVGVKREVCIRREIIFDEDQE